MAELLRITPQDNVAVALTALSSGQTVTVDGILLTTVTDVPAGHKVALFPIKAGEKVIKYGFPIGYAKEDIPVGAHVHVHNLHTGLSGELTYEYHPTYPTVPQIPVATFMGYPRKDGRVGVRNELWILPTVGCVNDIARQLERAAQERGVTDPVKARNIARLAGGDLVELQHLVAGESDALRKENFELFCGLMRLSYNDRHLELVTWAEEAAQLSREQQRAFLRDASRLLRESYMLHAGINEISYLWGEELAFCSKFAPFVGSQNIEPLIAEIECALAQISQNGNPTIVFTHFALSVSKMIKRL